MRRTVFDAVMLRVSAASKSSSSAALAALSAPPASRLPHLRLRHRGLATAAPQRPHPLAPLPKTPQPSGGSRSTQRWSTLTAILLATVTGSTTYVLGLTSGGGDSASTTKDGKARGSYKEPTRAGFDAGLEGVRAFLPEDCIATDRHTLEAHGHSDWSYHDPEGLPGAVLYPRSTDDVVKIVKLASQHAIPIIPYSGGTNLEGHTQPISYDSNVEDRVVSEKRKTGQKVTLADTVPGFCFMLDFSENMNQIVKVNAEDLDCVVQPGVSYNVLNEHLRDEGIPLFFPVDPAPGAMIGGMVGTGASGTNAVRYGTMRENVLNLTVVLPSGEVIKTRSRAKKSSAGPDLTKLFIGSEGCFGIVTEATLKLAPVLPSRVAVTAFPTVRDAAEAVRQVVQQGVGVACVEFLDEVMVAAINKANAGTSWEEKPSIFFKFSGNEAQMKNDIDQTRKITQSCKGSKFIFSKDDKEAEEIWYSRKVALWSAIDYVQGSKAWTTDVCVPISNFPQLVAETKEDLIKEGIVGPMVGHAGDGNFHALLLYTNPEEFRKVEGLVDRMVHRAQRLDGTCTGEHGVGMGKMGHLEDELGAGTVGLLRDIKRLLDPQNLCNPGKLIPGVLEGRKIEH